jgi:hypothetical protein
LDGGLYGTFHNEQEKGRVPGAKNIIVMFLCTRILWVLPFYPYDA